MEQLYLEKEIVGVKDKGKLYEAKILKAQYWNNTWNYFVHFQGWNKKWDRWTEEKDISKKTGSIRRRYGAKEKIQIENSDVENGKDESESENENENDDDDNEDDEDENGDEDDNSNDNEKRKNKKNEKKNANKKKKLEHKRKKVKKSNEDNLDDEISDDNSMLKLQIPLTLKKHLTDEWEAISKNPHRLLVLPRTHTVEIIINQFVEDKISSDVDNEQNEKLRDIFQCLICYFNRALPLILLYHNEREQYNLIAQTPNFLPSKVYGGEHLLRLFVKLPQLFVNIDITTTDLRYLKQKFTEFLKYLQKSSSTYFNLSDYQIQKTNTTTTSSINTTTYPPTSSIEIKLKDSP